MKKQNSEAITLIALAITIVVLMIIAAVSITLTVGKNGIINKAKTSNMMAKKAQEECNVTYNANAGEEVVTGTVEDQNIRPGFSILAKENNYERSDYEFIGWSKYPSGKDTNNEDSIYAAGAKIKIEENTILYAQWERVTVTITFDENGGTGTMAPISVGIDIETELPSNTFTRNEYKFVKWNTQADGSETDYTTNITTNQNITLYAIWDYVSAFDEGEGTEQTPYEIHSAETFNRFAQKVNSGTTFSGQYIILTQDIDFTNKDVVSVGKTYNTKFKGNFDGQNYKIKGVSVNKTYTSTSPYYALFESIEDATIKNVEVDNINIKVTTGPAAGLVLYAKSSTIENCTTSGRIETYRSTYYAGGICGAMEAGTISECANLGIVQGRGAGMSGQSDYNLKQGGIIGWSNGVTISDCYNNGELKLYSTSAAYSHIGGIAGKYVGNNSRQMINCYNAKVISDGAIKKSGIVADNQYNNAPITNCFYATSTYKGISTTNDVSGSTTAQTEEQLKALTTQLNNGGNIWKNDENNINEGYPILNWQN